MGTHYFANSRRALELADKILLAAEGCGYRAQFRTKKPGSNYNAWTGVFLQSFLNSIDSAQPKNEERLAG